MLPLIIVGIILIIIPPFLHFIKGILTVWFEKNYYELNRLVKWSYLLVLIGLILIIIGIYLTA